MKPVEIIGGGVAGLALGILLRREGVPVRIVEAGDYPRHRVCGEFISGAGQAVIERMGLVESLRKAGAREARTCTMFAGNVRSQVRQFPNAALCISRHKLDALLAQEFTRSRGELETRHRCPETDDVPGRVWATGRRPFMQERGWVWYGVKVHASNMHLGADLEMHIVPNGYVGMCVINDGLVNVCGLFRRPAGKPGAQTGCTAISRLKGPVGSQLNEKLAGAIFAEKSFCSVAGLGWNQNPRPDSCSIGDAFKVTPPVTGNGMSMALETAEIALDPLLNYSQGEVDWSEAVQSIFQRCQCRLSSRLRWAGWLQTALMSKLLDGKPGEALLKSDFLWRLFFQTTRCG